MSMHPYVLIFPCAYHVWQAVALLQGTTLQNLQVAGGSSHDGVVEGLAVGQMWTAVPALSHRSTNKEMHVYH